MQGANPNSLPLLPEEGWLRGELNVAELPYSAQTGAKRERDSASINKWWINRLLHHPVCGDSEGGHSIDAAATPPRRGGENSKTTRGAATVEFTLTLVAGILPLTLGLLAFAEIGWTYHVLATITRQGARYAATHCWQDDTGSNVVNWMQANAPAFPDRAQLESGGIQIQVSYWTHDPITNQSVPFSCSGGCNAQCVPDSVTVSIVGYQFNHFLTPLGLQPLQVPSFSTTVEMQGAGGDPETALSTP